MTIHWHSDIKYITWRETRGFKSEEHQNFAECLSWDALRRWTWRKSWLCSAALGLMLGPCQTCVRSSHSQTKITGENHTSSFQNCSGRRTAIDWLLDGGQKVGEVIAISLLSPPPGRNMRCVILGERLTLCGVIWVADSWFKAYAMPPFGNWSSHCPISWGHSQGYHLLSSTDLTMGLSFINSFIWEGDMLPLLRCEQSLSLHILIPGGTRVFLSGTPASGMLGFRWSSPACLPWW